MKISVLGNHVILKEIKAEERTMKSGIVLAKESVLEMDSPVRGVVYAMDSQHINIIQKGQTVIFRKYAFDEVMIDNEPFLSGDVDDIVAILE